MEETQEKEYRVKVQTLTSEAMRPYGECLTLENPIYPEVDEGQGVVAMELNTLERNDSPRQSLDQMSIHGSYNQTWVLLEGSIIFCVAPAPENMYGNPEELEFDYDNLAAFYFSPGQTAQIKRGVWHGMHVLSESATFINVTRKDSGEGTTRVIEVDDEGIKYTREYIELVNIRRRDKCRIVLEI